MIITAGQYAKIIINLTFWNNLIRSKDSVVMKWYLSELNKFLKIISVKIVVKLIPEFDELKQLDVLVRRKRSYEKEKRGTEDFKKTSREKN